MAHVFTAAKKNLIIDIIVLAFIAAFLLGCFRPDLLLLKTTTNGGDTGSHYPTAVYLKEVFFPQGKIMGWMRGNYAGFPLFYHYFPLTFILTAGLSYLMPMQIAFKLISVIGIFLLPLFTYFAFRLLKYCFPIPIAAAVFTLPFLFMEANSMWGGNIPSALAGEISYSLSFALAVLFFGTVYRGIEENKHIILNSLLVALIGMSHGYTLIFTGIISAFHLFTRKNFIENLKYLLKIYSLAILLLSFWLIPFIANLPYVTSYVARWQIRSFLEVAPPIIVPFLIISVFSLFSKTHDRRNFYFIYTISACLFFYFISPQIGMLDIRFIPFIQFYAVIFSTIFVCSSLINFKAPELLPLIIFLTVILWVMPNSRYIKDWIKWNYSGFEAKEAWPLYSQINNYLKENGKGRVVYEHSPQHNIFGTERAFENLPYFAKRDTLEGLYMQSSISSPFIFCIQSEISTVFSGPFPQYKYSHLNLKDALPHLEMFNVGQYIVRSPQAKELAKTVKELKLEQQFGDYEIYRVLTNSGNYVVPLKYTPVLFETNNWKTSFYDWFKNNTINDVHLVYSKDTQRFKLKTNTLNAIPIVPTNIGRYSIKEEIKNEEIVFDTTLIGHPHLIKVSYHPNWQVEGADRIYLASPSFMLVYPKEKHVRLYFGKTVFNYVGETMTSIGLIFGIILFVNAKRKNIDHPPHL